jgi:hypothetical protein
VNIKTTITLHVLIERVMWLAVKGLTRFMLICGKRMDGNSLLSCLAECQSRV